jgi:hypothetical protein
MRTIFQKITTALATAYESSSSETLFLTFSESCLRNKKYLIVCQQSGSFGPVIEGEGCPINQKSVVFLVTGLGEPDADDDDS